MAAIDKPSSPEEIEELYVIPECSSSDEEELDERGSVDLAAALRENQDAAYDEIVHLQDPGTYKRSLLNTGRAKRRYHSI